MANVEKEKEDLATGAHAYEPACITKCELVYVFGSRQAGACHSTHTASATRAGLAMKLLGAAPLYGSEET
jgi:hypothetical protein